MAKATGLGDNLYIAAKDVSGDIAMFSSIHGGPAPLEMTTINQSAHSRQGGLRDGGISATAFFDTAVGASHPTLSALPRTDVHVMYCRGTTLGNPAACCVAKQINYDGSMPSGGPFTFKVDAQANAFGLEWATLLTAGKRTDTAATNGTGVDFGTVGTAVTITSASAANPTSVLATAHGLITGDSVLISGTDKAALNAAFTVTVVDANHFTVAVDLTGGAATGGSFLKTNTNFGLQAYSQTFSVTGTSVTEKLQHSNDDAATDPYADITGGGFTVVLAAATGQERIATTATLQIKRWIREATTGTFNPAIFAIAAVRNDTAVAF